MSLIVTQSYCDDTHDPLRVQKVIVKATQNHGCTQIILNINKAILGRIHKVLGEHTMSLWKSHRVIVMAQRVIIRAQKSTWWPKMWRGCNVIVKVKKSHCEEYKVILKSFKVIVKVHKQVIIKSHRESLEMYRDILRPNKVIFRIIQSCEGHTESLWK